MIKVRSSSDGCHPRVIQYQAIFTEILTQCDDFDNARRHMYKRLYDEMTE